MNDRPYGAFGQLSCLVLKRMCEPHNATLGNGRACWLSLTPKDTYSGKRPENQSCLLAVLVLTLHVGHVSSSMSRTPISAGPLAEAELFDHIADVCYNVNS
jgi:hypothetical protein